MADGFQVSISTLTLGTLYEAVLAFSSQENVETFWPLVCFNARWLVPSRRVAIVLCSAHGNVELVGTFEKGKYQRRCDSTPVLNDALGKAIKASSAHWIPEPEAALEGTGDELTRWLLRDRPRMLLVVPLRTDGKNTGAMLFAMGGVSETDRAMLNTLGTIYALHVGMAYTLLRVSEERRQIQNQLETQERMASLGSLVAGVLHEMNTPLGALNGANDVTSRCVSRMEQAENLEPSCRNILGVLHANTEVVNTATGRIRDIVQSLKNFARLDEAEYQIVDLREGIESTLTLLAGELEGRITVDKEFEALPTMKCRPAQLNQVLMCLLKNAVQAIDGRGTIRIRTFVARECVHIEIADDGRGIPPGKLDKMFELDFSTSGPRVKMGTGLAAASHIVQSHGGRIDVASEPGKGSTFTIRLPIHAESVDAGRARP